MSYEMKNQIKIKEINEMKAELEVLQSQISDQRIDNEEIRINNENLRAIIEKKSNEINKIKENIDGIRNQNQNMIKSLEENEKNVKN